MPKFEATSIEDLFTVERDAGRVARRAAYAPHQMFTHIVACEASDGSWCEMDAESLEHGKLLATTAVEKLGARGCSVWTVRDDGTVGVPEFKYFWLPEEEETE
jgi:hypothetical protein